MRVITHFNLDLDAVSTLWAVRTFVPGYADAEATFVPANWNGEMRDGDIAVDINAGGRGLKGEKRADGTIGSALSLILDRYASPSDRAALSSLVAFVDAQDAHGSAVKWLAPEASQEGQLVLGETGLNAVFRAFQARFPRNDQQVADRMSEVFDGMLTAGRARQRAEVEADRAEIIGDGTVAIVRNAREFATNGVLYGRGVRVIVFIDGDNLGVIREGEEPLRMDHPDLVAVVEAAGEQLGDGPDRWFAHPAGFMLAWGSRKAPATSPSRVRAEDLAATAARLLAPRS